MKTLEWDNREAREVSGRWLSVAYPLEHGLPVAPRNGLAPCVAKYGNTPEHAANKRDADKLVYETIWAHDA